MASASGDQSGTLRPSRLSMVRSARSSSVRGSAGTSALVHRRWRHRSSRHVSTAAPATAGRMHSMTTRPPEIAWLQVTTDSGRAGPVPASLAGPPDRRCCVFNRKTPEAKTFLSYERRSDPIAQYDLMGGGPEGRSPERCRFAGGGEAKTKAPAVPGPSNALRKRQ